MKRLLQVVSAIAVLLVAGVAAFVATAPRPEPSGEVGRSLFAAGPHAVGKYDTVLEDASRPTAPNGDFPGAASRSLRTRVWYPASGSDVAREGAPFPLLIYSHGFMGARDDNASFAEHFASRGFVVAAADFPLSSRSAPGEPQFADVAHQPGDVSFLIDTLLDWSGDEAHRFALRIDPDRVGVMGLSLGGMTTSLVAFHPRLRDPRVKAAVSIAGPSSMFAGVFYRSADVPFLMIAGDADALVDYATNGPPVLARVPGALLMTLAQGTHLGFTDAAAVWFRWLSYPDSVACAALEGNVPEDQNPFVSLGGPAEGIIEEPETPVPCLNDVPERAMRPGRQLMLTKLALTAFLEAHLSGGGSRAAHALSQAVADENPDVELGSADQPS